MSIGGRQQGLQLENLFNNNLANNFIKVGHLDAARRFEARSCLDIRDLRNQGAIFAELVDEVAGDCSAFCRRSKSLFSVAMSRLTHRREENRPPGPLESESAQMAEFRDALES